MTDDRFRAAPHLRGVPQLPDDLAALAGRVDLAAADRRRLGREIRRLARLVRAARERWERLHGPLPD
jgi:hypothetical protein